MEMRVQPQIAVGPLDSGHSAPGGGEAESTKLTILLSLGIICGIYGHLGPGLAVA
jgi:hypothetical protein